MRSQISYTALALALLAGTSAANAQTMIPSQPVATVVTQPFETVQTTETVQTLRPARRSRVARRRVVTTRTTVSERVVPAPTFAPAVAAYPQPPLYDVVAPPPAPLATPPAYPPPLYDEATMPIGAAAAPPAYGAPAVAVPTYRYVYEPDRILVIDPATNIAIQAIPR